MKLMRLKFKMVTSSLAVRPPYGVSIGRGGTYQTPATKTPPHRRSPTMDL